MLKKLFGGGRVWGVGCGVWGFIDFQVVNYLIFREKVQEFSPRSPQWLALFEGKKVQKSYPTRFLDLFSRPYLSRLVWIFPVLTERLLHSFDRTF
ncbi:unknown protein [Microcystis aeruginosa NIES-843]|uniref:Type IV pilin PilA n=1 Tax=Microcystis aeruginosa (strain NIES-843 / IAM M-2473) TaxID=449447 RepID=B0JTM1_MICAN|nr:hypothetical protein [Microcystis aeruginosa]BAG04324.1 unknown protein [Microcystis aeruginosa NIES-843]